MWPNYTRACRADVDALLRRGGSLSAYRANPQVGVEPAKDSWAWRLERDVEKRFSVRHAVAVNSGTAALHAALVSLDLRGREVVTSPYTFSATVAAILQAGGTPRFADVDPDDFCITKETVKPHVTKKTACILPVHLFGGLADVSSLRSFGLPVIEDACQAVGARSWGRYSGTLGLAGCYSFNGTKNVPAGECGALVTNSDKVAETGRLLMNHGENFWQKTVGYNYRPNEVTCCIAWHGLQTLRERNKRRSDLAHVLIEQFDCGQVAGVETPNCCEGAPQNDGEDHVYYVFPLKVKAGTRPRFIKRMAKRGIPVGAGYIQPTLNRYKAFRQYQRGPLPVVEELSAKTLCILSTLTPDRPLTYAGEVAKAIKESLG